MSDTSHANTSPGEPPDLIIGLDAATPITSGAVATTEGRLLDFTRQEGRMPASRRLLADAAQLLPPEEIAPDQIRAVAVTLGPGMFTGLRVALAIAKTLAHGWNATLYGYSSLEIVARRWPLAGSVVCVLLDARRGELYSGIYRPRTAERPESLRTDRVEPIEALLGDLADAPWPEIYFSGGGAGAHRELIERSLGERARWIQAPWDGPGADALALAGAEDLRRGRPGIDPLGAMPVYLRASDAERRHATPALRWM